MTRIDFLGEEFRIKVVNDFCNVERSVDDTAAKGLPCTDMAFILFLSSAVRWPAKAGSAYVILDMIRPMNSSCNA